MVLERWGVLLLKENILVKKKGHFLENVELDVYADESKDYRSSRFSFEG